MTDQPTSRPRLVQRVWRSIFRGPVAPRTDQERKQAIVHNLILHLRPVRVPASTLRYTHTFGLGGMSLVLVLVLVLTGALLRFAYEPAPGAAYESIVRLQDGLLFGSLVRSIHYWSANFLILVVVLHLLRTYFTGAYHPPRQFNWVIGLALLLCVIASNFTGYLLPWDQLSYWAITISTGMLEYVPLAGDWLRRLARGGAEIGQPTLTTFYTLHTTVVPVLILTLMAFHFWRVRKARGVVVPRRPGEDAASDPERVLTLPYLLARELAVALALIAVVMVTAALVGAPLGEAANAGMSPNPAKAPWYFMGFQELLLHFHPLFAVVVLPLAAAGAFLAVPYYRYDRDPSGIWFASMAGRRLAVAAAVAGLAITPVLVVLDEYLIDLPSWLPWLPASVSNGLLPVLLLGGALWGATAWVRRRHAATDNEVGQTMFVFFAVCFATLTAIGVWFRGPGMSLVWPWNR
jgi:quinol-cytochrome oxidoreductase complex cytochrome b subunit